MDYQSLLNRREQLLLQLRALQGAEALIGEINDVERQMRDAPPPPPQPSPSNPFHNVTVEPVQDPLVQALVMQNKLMQQQADRAKLESLANLDIPKFDGINQYALPLFLQSIESAFCALDCEDLFFKPGAAVRVASLKLQGLALAWFNIQASYYSTLTWSEFKKEIQATYGLLSSREVALINLKQLSKEGCSDWVQFCAKWHALYSMVVDTHTTLTDLEELMFLQLFRDALPPAL